MSPLLRVEHLYKSYFNNDEKKEIIHDLNLNVFEKEFICILGKSGCGKSTLLKTIGGFDTDYQGIIEENGLLITSPSIERVMIFQNTNQLLPWKSVLENIVFPLKAQYSHFKKEILQTIAKEYMSLVGMSAFADYYPYQLSGGMKQRTALARALALKPSILLMDEPFSSLDAMTRSSLQDLLTEIWQKVNSTILFVTHDIEEAMRLSTKIVVMDFAPNSVKGIIKNDLSFPRGDLNEQYIALNYAITQLLYK